MLVCRNRSRGGPFRAALALGLLIALPAAAQNGPPIQLIPGTSPDQRVGTPLNGVGDSPAHGSAPAEFTTEPLAPLDTAWVGTLHESDGGLPRTLWQSTSRDFLRAVLPQLAPSTSPVVQDLSRRLLLSDALSPSGEDPADHPALLTLRLDRILALGLVGEGAALVRILPQTVSNDGLDRDRVELLFAGNDTTGACREVQERIAQYQDYWWDRALVACQALMGDGAKASLGLSLLREQKAAPDPAFDALIDSLGGHPRRIETLSDPSPLQLALVAAAKQPLPPDALMTAGPAALYGWATNDGVPPVQRLAAAEHAALFGALPPANLAEIYVQVGGRAEEPAAPSKGSQSAEGPRRRAALYATARSQQSAGERIAALTALIREARASGTFPLMAKIVAPIVEDMAPEAGPGGFGADAARVLLAGGKPDQAMLWLGSGSDPPLRLIQHLAAGGPSSDGAALLHDALATLARRDNSAAARQADLLMALMTAFDEPTGGLDDVPLVASARVTTLPTAAVWNLQQQATIGKRIGETVLTTLLLANAGGSLTPEPIVLARAINGLRAVGLDRAARALAVEAALAAGI